MSADLEAIIRLKHLYGLIVDGMCSGEYSPADLAQVLTADARLAYPPPTGERTGLEAIVPFFDQIRLARSASWHNFGNPVIDIDGDTARGRWTVMARHTTRGEDAHTGVAYGRYAERYLRTPDGWRIAELVYSREP